MYLSCMNQKEKLINCKNIIFTITFKEKKSVDALSKFNAVLLDDNSMEVDLTKNQTLNELMEQLTASGFTVIDIRPQGHRLEKLFLNILKK